LRYEPFPSRRGLVIEGFVDIHEKNSLFLNMGLQSINQIKKRT